MGVVAGRRWALARGFLRGVGVVFVVVVVAAHRGRGGVGHSFVFFGGSAVRGFIVVVVMTAAAVSAVRVMGVMSTSARRRTEGGARRAVGTGHAPVRTGRWRPRGPMVGEVGSEGEAEAEWAGRWAGLVIDTSAGGRAHVHITGEVRPEVRVRSSHAGFRDSMLICDYFKVMRFEEL